MKSIYAREPKSKREVIIIQKERVMKKEDFKKITPEMVERVRDLLHEGNCRKAYTGGTSKCSTCPFSFSNSTSGLGCVASGRSNGHCFAGVDKLLKKSCEDFLQIAKEIYPEKKEEVIENPKFDPIEKKWKDMTSADNVIESMKVALRETNYELARQNAWGVIRKYEKTKELMQGTAQNVLHASLWPRSWRTDLPEKLLILIGAGSCVQIEEVDIRKVPFGCLNFELQHDFSIEEVNSALSRFSCEDIAHALYCLEWSK